MLESKDFFRPRRLLRHRMQSLALRMADECLGGRKLSRMAVNRVLSRSVAVGVIARPSGNRQSMTFGLHIHSVKWLFGIGYVPRIVRD